MTDASAGESTTARPRSGAIVLAICLVTIVFDGYDLVVYGSTVPSLLAYEEWGLEPATAGLIGSAALVGMLLGTLTVGVITDRVGRRRILLGAIAWFSIGMLLTALAPNLLVFGVLRFVTGIGLGAVVPTCIALTVEFARKDRRQVANAVMFSGYSIGGIAAALLAIALLPVADFRVLYAIGALPLVVLLPFAWKYLPESVSYLARHGRTSEAKATADQYGLVYDDIVEPASDDSGRGADDRSAVRQLFSKRWIRATLLFAAMNFSGLLLVYGLNTWLPQIMRSAGYPLGDSLAFLLVLNAGAIVGVIGTSMLADRIGIQKVVVACFALAAVSILLLSLGLTQGVMFFLVAVAGLGSVGTQILVGGFCAVHYPAHLVPTALSWGLGIGRLGAISGPLVGGYIAASGMGFEVNFFVFAAIALIGIVIALCVPHARVLRARASASAAPEHR